MINRRRFLQGSAAGLGLAATGRLWAQEAMEPWRRGVLEIHHISTGRGNSVLAILPDGTSVMVDAGAVKASGGAEFAVAKPDASRRPGEWIGRYAKYHLRTTPKQEIGTFVLTHLHGDHMGEYTEALPVAKDGSYRLTGVSDVAEVLPIRRIVDRGWPDYSYPAQQTDKSALNYIAFVRSMAKRGVAVERAKVGSARQIEVENGAEFGTLSARVLAANGEVWTGVGEGSRKLFPALETLTKREYPTENMCSCALRLSYGAFQYYNGGDLTCDTQFGTEPWMDVESAVAKVAGPVSVAALNHHGYYDAEGPDFVRAMRARIWVLQSWHASHPALATLDRLYSPVLYAGERDVLATSLVPAAELADARLSDKMLSQQGHVAVRVAPGGATYEVVVLEDAVEMGKVKARFGPFAS